MFDLQDKKEKIIGQLGTSTGWKNLLNANQVLPKRLHNFPDVRACQLRMAYSKLDSARLNNSVNLDSLTKTKGSFLLDKPTRPKNKNIQLAQISQHYKLTTFNKRQSRYTRGKHLSERQYQQLARTIDISDISKIKQSPKKIKIQFEAYQQKEGGLNKKRSQHFTDYFKRLFSEEKTNSDPIKLFSQGKCVDISDRIYQQKLERIKLTIENKKIEEKEKSFRCVSKKLSKYGGKKQKDDVMLPGLRDRSRNQMNQNNSSFPKPNRNKQETRRNLDYQFEPWESNYIQNYDIQSIQQF